MKLLPSWIREFVNVPGDDQKLADDLSMAGISVEGIENERGENVYEVDITTNRVDAMHHYGVARECAAIYNTDLKPFPAVAADQATQSAFSIQIDSPNECGRYSGRIVRGVTIKPAPEKIAERLTLLGSRPISNVADATNYALWELGHPTHAFDLDLLDGKIIVRMARDGEVLKTLDGLERKLTSQDLVIADASKAVALAGIMGGFDTMITEKTKNVLIEAAWFDPTIIRRTARRLAMHTDASHRFERGADYGMTATAANRVAQLIFETAGGQIEGSLIDVIGRDIKQPAISLHRSEVQRILGKDITDDEITRILRHLGFQVSPGRIRPAASLRESAAVSGRGGTHAAVVEEIIDFSVQPPSWRLDIEREIDVIEEIARIHGYDRFPNSLPTFSAATVELPSAAKEAGLRSGLLALGYDEAISLAFISHDDAKQFSTTEAVEIANPLSEEASVMRSSMIPGMLNMLAHNLNRGSFDVQLFESGNVYEKVGEKTAEHQRLVIGATGNANGGGVHGKARPYTFFDLKGDIEHLLSAFDYKTLSFDSKTADLFHPGRSARIIVDGAPLAQIGQLHPQVAAQRKLKQDVYVAEIDLERLYKVSLRNARYEQIPRFPAVERDLSFVFSDGITFERIDSIVRALNISELRNFIPAEIFRGGSVPSGQYSLLVRAEFQGADRTLRDEEVAIWSAQIVKALQSLGGTQRA